MSSSSEFDFTTDKPPLWTFPYLQPLPLVFQSRHDAFQAAQAVAKANGYGLVQRRKNTPRHYEFRCSRWSVSTNGHGITQENRQRDTSSAKCNCPFFLLAICPEDRPSSPNPYKRWEIRVSKVYTHHYHNHGPADPSALTVHRKLTSQQEEYIRHHLVGVLDIKPKVLTRKLRSDFPDFVGNSTTVGNAIERIKKEDRTLGQTTTEILLTNLLRQGIHAKVEMDRFKVVDRLFVSFPELMNLLKTDSEVLFVDATYRTNK
jgi:hypothetical protein